MYHILYYNFFMSSFFIKKYINCIPCEYDYNTQSYSSERKAKQWIGYLCKRASSLFQGIAKHCKEHNVYKICPFLFSGTVLMYKSKFIFNYLSTFITSHQLIRM